jgi:hypothetical protein
MWRVLIGALIGLLIYIHSVVRFHADVIVDDFQGRGKYCLMELLIKPGFIDYAPNYIRVIDFFLFKLESRETYINMARNVAYSKVGARNGSKCAEVGRIGYCISPAFVTYPESFRLRERYIDSLGHRYRSRLSAFSRRS